MSKEKEDMRMVSFFLVPVIVGIMLPWIVQQMLFERGKFRHDRLIAKCPKIARIASWGLLILFSFGLIMCYINEDVKNLLNVLYIIAYIIILASLVLLYMCYRYKIVLDLNKQEVIIYRLFKTKKAIAFKNIYKHESDGEIVNYKDGENNKLFSTWKLLSGYGEFANCLIEIEKCNREQRPISVKKLEHIIKDYHEFMKKL